MDEAFVKVDAIARTFEGWLNPKERPLLYNLAKACKGRGVIAEIGSWKGNSTSYLGTGSKMGPNAKVYAIDPHAQTYVHEMYSTKSTFETFKENIKKAGVEDIVVPIRAFSEEAAKTWDKPIELLWIDGDHSYKAAKLDFDLFFPFVIDGGVVAYHDATSGEVKQVIKERIFFSGNFADCDFVQSVAYARKVMRPLTLGEKSHNFYVYAKMQLIDLTRFLVPQAGRARVKTLAKKVFKRV
jgi:predicted O-methyltransferase YrrM